MTSAPVKPTCDHPFVGRLAPRYGMIIALLSVPVTGQTQPKSRVDGDSLLRANQATKPTRSPAVFMSHPSCIGTVQNSLGIRVASLGWSDPMATVVTRLVQVRILVRVP